MTARGTVGRIHRKALRIEFGDCDPAGIVYFPRYFELLDACTNAAIEAVGYKKRDLLRHFGIAGIPAVEVKASFRASCTFGDDVHVLTRIIEWGRSSFRVHHQLWHVEQLAVDAVEVRVWTVRDSEDPGRLKAAPVPDEFRKLFD